MARFQQARSPYCCSFCGKSQDQVERLIAGPGRVFICDECVALCQEIIEEGRASRRAATSAPEQTPLPGRCPEGDAR